MQMNTKTLQELKRIYPAGFSTCGNVAEMRQRLDWLQHGMLWANLNDGTRLESTAVYERKLFQELWKGG